MRTIVVTGIGTGVGKTLVSSILAVALRAHYWKPFSCGRGCDRSRVLKLAPSAKSFPEPLVRCKSVAELTGCAHIIDIERVRSEFRREGSRLIIEGVGGLLVPIGPLSSFVDLFHGYQPEWIVVSRHYVGSINHTLLTLEALKARGILHPYLVFNGFEDVEKEQLISKLSGARVLARLLPEKKFGEKEVQKYAKMWKGALCKLR